MSCEFVTIIFRSENHLGTFRNKLANAFDPDVPKVRMLVRILRVFVCAMLNLDLRVKLFHPLVAKMAGDRFGFERADDNSQLLHLLSGKLNQVLMSFVRGHELAKYQPCCKFL